MIIFVFFKIFLLRQLFLNKEIFSKSYIFKNNIVWKSYESEFTKMDSEVIFIYYSFFINLFRRRTSSWYAS